MKTRLFLLLLAISTFTLKAADIHVPADYATIQEAIDAASSGDVIIVANGTYIENIDFLGKDITVTSNYATSGDINDIYNTVIDGSQPTDPDIGSCVSFKTGETNDSILQGFTITGGSGTKTYNPADDAYFRTGGGILINQTSPTIKNNIIKENHCIAETGVTGAGGGGIRMGFGQPIITNNVISYNSGGYAGGVMIAYCEGATIKNNLIAFNVATGSFNGGGGVYVDWEPVTLENNTIVNNHSGDKGGAIITTGTTTVIINCIIYGNTATNAFPQIFKRYGGNANLTYTNIEGGFDGDGNEDGMITDDPLFDNQGSFLLSASSPCIDAGHPGTEYNDVEDPGSPGNALFPAQGTTRNDMGAYGGQGAEDFLSILEHAPLEGIKISCANPYQNEGVLIHASENGRLRMQAYSFEGKLILNSEEIIINKGDNTIPLVLPSSAFVLFQDQNGNKTVLKIIKK